MTEDHHTFTGKWITSPEFARLNPVNVFHRQLEPIKEKKSDIENRHILFRKKFILAGDDEKAKALVHISADDCGKIPQQDSLSAG